MQIYAPGSHYRSWNLAPWITSQEIDDVSLGEKLKRTSVIYEGRNERVWGWYCSKMKTSGTSNGDINLILRFASFSTHPLLCSSSFFSTSFCLPILPSNYKKLSAILISCHFYLWFQIKIFYNIFVISEIILCFFLLLLFQGFWKHFNKVGVTVGKEREFPQMIAQMLHTLVALVWQVSLSSREK